MSYLPTSALNIHKLIFLTVRYDTLTTSTPHGSINLPSTSPLVRSLSLLLRRIPYGAPILPTLPEIIFQVPHVLADKECAELIQWHLQEVSMKSFLSSLANMDTY